MGYFMRYLLTLHLQNNHDQNPMNSNCLFNLIQSIKEKISIIDF